MAICKRRAPAWRRDNTMSTVLWRRLLVLILASLGLSACALRAPAPSEDGLALSTARGAQLQGTLVELATQRPLAFEAFVKAVAQAQVAAVGEEPYHPRIPGVGWRRWPG